MQEHGKFDCKINILPNGLEKYMTFSLDIKSVFTDSLHVLSSLLDRLLRNLGKNDSKHSSEELDSEVLDLVKQIGFYPFE